MNSQNDNIKQPKPVVETTPIRPEEQPDCVIINEETPVSSNRESAESHSQNCQNQDSCDCEHNAQTPGATDDNDSACFSQECHLEDSDESDDDENESEFNFFFGGFPPRPNGFFPPPFSHRGHFGPPGHRGFGLPHFGPLQFGPLGQFGPLQNFGFRMPFDGHGRGHPGPFRNHGFGHRGHNMRGASGCRFSPMGGFEFGHFRRNRRESGCPV